MTNNTLAPSWLCINVNYACRGAMPNVLNMPVRLDAI
jgi:hypothetical protein